jgi:signal transduction histidine kinase
VRLADVLKPVVEKYALLCGDRVSLRVCADFEELPPVETDPKSIARIADILLNNGMKFTGENGVIWLDAAVDSRAVTLCVRDNGVGIPRKDQGRIFERFYMGDPSHNANGSGLGLAIARELTDRSKEKLWVESEPGRGAAFFFTVRRA